MPSNRALFGPTIFLGAFLLFLIEPIAAKQLLPVLGGSSAVWVTCLVFFQMLLLLGYSYAHWLAGRVGRNMLHVGLLVAAAVLAFLNLAPHSVTASRHPVTMIFVTLANTIGLPFLLLSATSPLLQAWLARVEEGGVRYRLFALSNLGSLLALFLYPAVIEPHFTLHAQRMFWATGFVVYAALCSMLAVQVPRVSVPKVEVIEQVEERVSRRQVLLWFLLPMAASMQLAAVTAHLSQNIAPIPLLWIVPLAAYLLSFIVAFEFPALYKRGPMIRLLVVFLAALGYTLSKAGVQLTIGVAIGFFVLELLLACLFLHAEAYAVRPEGARRSTMFYLTLAAGGAVGTFLIGIVSPMIFRANYDIAISFFVTAAAAAFALWGQGWTQRVLWVTASVLLLMLVRMQMRGFDAFSMLLVRNFYGSLRVTQTYVPPDKTMRTLVNGIIQHGTQIFSPDDGPGSLRRTPTTYYSLGSGAGVAMLNCCESRPRNVGVVGLGAGTMAAYGRRGDRFRFYEINPAVEPIARNLFTYIRESGAQVTVVEGDARVSLANEAPNGFDVLVVDAFSGDAIPLHLLTVQALALYERHLAPGGVIAFHLSNQFLDLPPEVGALARNAGMHALLIENPSNDATGVFRSTWVLLTRNDAFVAQQAVSDAMFPMEVGDTPVWTDDYSSLMPLINWGNH